MAGLGLENRQLKVYRRVFGGLCQFSIPFDFMGPFSLVVAGGPGQEPLFPLRCALESFLHIPGTTDHQTQRLLRRLDPIQLRCRCRQPDHRPQRHRKKERSQQRHHGRKSPKIDPDRRRRICGAPPGLGLLRVVERHGSRLDHRRNYNMLFFSLEIPHNS